MTQIADLIEGRPLVYAEIDDTVREVARRMADKNIGAVAVLHEGKLVGIFSERDMMTRVVAQSLDPDKTQIATVMTKNIVVAEPQDHVDDALQKMYTLGCRHLPVVADGNLLAMISLRDLLLFDTVASRDKASFLSELVTYSPDYES